MTLPKAKLTLRPGTGEVIVDGQTIGGVRDLDLNASAREIPRLTLDLLLAEVEIDGEMEVLVPESTREALIALGWTPPLEGQARDGQTFAEAGAVITGGGA